MENYFYKCEKCGFVHLIPAYWVSFNPEPQIEYVHINMTSREECENRILTFLEEN